MVEKITPEMIEAAARAIREQFGNRCRLVRRTWQWEKLPAKVQDEYLAEASAALKAGLGVQDRRS